jgi:hypothetical protein
MSMLRTNGEVDNRQEQMGHVSGWETIYQSWWLDTHLGAPFFWMSKPPRASPLLLVGSTGSGLCRRLEMGMHPHPSWAKRGLSWRGRLPPPPWGSHRILNPLFTPVCSCCVCASSCSWVCSLIPIFQGTSGSWCVMENGWVATLWLSVELAPRSWLQC